MEIGFTNIRKCANISIYEKLVEEESTHTDRITEKSSRKY